MRVAWQGLQLDALDYEIVRIGSAHTFDEVGTFRDVYFSAAPTWRLVAGYLMFTSHAPGELSVFSHGRLVATLYDAGDTAVWQAEPGTDGAAHWEDAGEGIRSGGIALVVAGSTVPEVDGATVRLRSGVPWALTVVHGPAAEKIDARIRLMQSLERVGGRNA